MVGEPLGGVDSFPRGFAVILFEEKGDQGIEKGRGEIEEKIHGEILVVCLLNLEMNSEKYDFVK